MGNEMLAPTGGIVGLPPEAPDSTSSIQERTPIRARTTPPPPPLLDQALAELATCLASLRLAEEVIRAQNGVLREHRTARCAERRRYLDLLAYVSDALLVTDVDGLILEASPAAARLLSGSRRLRPGKPIARFFTGDRRVALLGAVQATGGGAAWEGDLCIKPRRGVAFFAFVTVTPAPAAKDVPPCAGGAARLTASSHEPCTSLD